MGPTMPGSGLSHRLEPPVSCQQPPGLFPFGASQYSPVSVGQAKMAAPLRPAQPSPRPWLLQ